MQRPFWWAANLFCRALCITIFMCYIKSVYSKWYLLEMAGFPPSFPWPDPGGILLHFSLTILCFSLLYNTKWQKEGTAWNRYPKEFFPYQTKRNPDQLPGWLGIFYVRTLQGRSGRDGLYKNFCCLRYWYWFQRRHAGHFSGRKQRTPPVPTASGRCTSLPETRTSSKTAAQQRLLLLSTGAR